MSCSKQTVSIEDICKDKHIQDDKKYDICKKIIITMLNVINNENNIKILDKILLKQTRTKEGMLRKTDIIHVYRQLIASGEMKKNVLLWSILQKYKSFLKNDLLFFFSPRIS